MTRFMNKKVQMKNKKKQINFLRLNTHCLKYFNNFLKHINQIKINSAKTKQQIIIKIYYSKIFMNKSNLNNRIKYGIS